VYGCPSPGSSGSAALGPHDPPGMPMSLSTASDPSRYSDMSTRPCAIVAEQVLREGLRISVLPTPWGREEKHPVRRYMFASGALVHPERLGDGATASFCPTAAGDMLLDVAEPVDHVPADEVGGFFVSDEITSRTSFAATAFSSSPRISTRTHAVSSQLITLSGSRSDLAYRSAWRGRNLSPRPGWSPVVRLQAGLSPSGSPGFRPASARRS